jgi:hypothetical protein
MAKRLLGENEFQEKRSSRRVDDARFKAYLVAKGFT